MDIEKNNSREETVQSSTTNPASDNTAGVVPANRTISDAQYQKLLVAQKIAKEYVLSKKMKEHNAIFSARRITVATRRIDLKATAPDLDVLAYIEICKMKDAIGQDATAAEPEITAYIDLWNEDGELTLDAINHKLQNANA